MICLDTHALVWWISNPEKLTQKARVRIGKELRKSEILISSISVWEIYLLVKKRRLNLTMDVDSWIEKIEALPFMKFVPVDNKIAARSVKLPGNLHEDPADRMIIATAREYGAELLTSDTRILKYPHVRTVW